MFQIIPYSSVGGIRFGASQAELVAAIGEPKRIRKNMLGEPDYRYDGFGVRFSGLSETVVEVGLTPLVDVRVQSVDVFKSPDAFDQLIN